MIGNVVASYIEQEPPQVFATGFADLDRVTNGGLRAGDLSVIGAASGVGKSAFAEQIAYNVSRDAPVLYLPLEMGERLTLLRMGARLDRVSYDTLQAQGLSWSSRDLLNSHDLCLLEPLMQYIFGANEIMKAVCETGVKVVIVDHVRHIDGWLNANGSHVGASAIVRRLRQFASEMHLHVVLCCQMNRTAYGKRPQMNQLQDTSALEQTASLVMLLHRPFQFRGALADTVTEMLIPKNRYGPCCMMHYRWVGLTMTLWPLTEEDVSHLTCCSRKGDYGGD